MVFELTLAFELDVPDSIVQPQTVAAFSEELVRQINNNELRQVSFYDGRLFQAIPVISVELLAAVAREETKEK